MVTPQVDPGPACKGNHEGKQPTSILARGAVSLAAFGALSGALPAFGAGFHYRTPREVGG